MVQVNILEAKTDFSKLIRLLETKREDYITVARNGKPVVRIVPIDNPPVFFASTFCRLLQKLFVGDCNYIL